MTLQQLLVVKLGLWMVVSDNCLAKVQDAVCQVFDRSPVENLGCNIVGIANESLREL